MKGLSLKPSHFFTCMCEDRNELFTGHTELQLVYLPQCVQTEFPEWKGFGCSGPAFKGGQTESSSPELHKPNLLLEMSVSRARAGRLLSGRLAGQVKSPRLNLRGAVRCCYMQLFNRNVCTSNIKMKGTCWYFWLSTGLFWFPRLLSACTVWDWAKRVWGWTMGTSTDGAVLLTETSELLCISSCLK